MYLPCIYLVGEVAVIVQIAKWGNSLAVRIPATHARDVGLTENVKAELSVREGKLVIEPLEESPPFDLDDLVAGITDDNRHQEIDTGPATGSEFR
jgi:antitoxin MazE